MEVDENAEVSEEPRTTVPEVMEVDTAKEKDGVEEVDLEEEPAEKDLDPDYVPEAAVVEEDESEMSLAERLRHNNKRGRGRRRKNEVQKLIDDAPTIVAPESTMKTKRTNSRTAARDLTQFSTLILECDHDGLSEAQLRVMNEGKKEYKLAQDKINEMIKNQTIIFQTKQSMVLQSVPANVPLRVQPPVGKVAIPPAPKITPSTIKAAQSIIANKMSTILRPQNKQQNFQIIQPTSNVTYLLQSSKNPVRTVRLNQKNGTQAAPVAPPAVIQLSGNIPLGQIPVIPSSAETVDLTQEDTVDSREITFNKLSGKTFPSLVVTARPNLRSKEMTPSVITRERAVLDSKVKTVLVHSPTKFTEWLIQQGLVRSEQVCGLHRDATGNPFKLKLGMYSDNTKFPFSGGYVWISECCPQKFVSVFSGSLFESSPHPPTILLKLIYHWCCQTSVNNVVQWVKVDNFYVKNFFTLLRAVCTAAVHTKLGFIGGMNRYVEVGVISLGTTSQDGHQRQVKVEVLGVMDCEAKKVRLMAVEPMAETDRNLRKRFSKILEPLTTWVHPASTILTDFSIDKSTLQALGFNTVYQNNSAEGGTILGGKRRNNGNVMDYLRKVVPRMFLNTLSLLNRSLIQQFLDEITWREQWGFSPPLTFDNIIAHLAEQTKAEYGEQLVNRLSSIAVNPFRNWNFYEQSKSTTTSMVTTQVAAAAQTTTEYEVSPSSLCEVQYAPGPAHSKRPRAQKTPQAIVNEGGSKALNAANASAIRRVKLNTSAQTYLDAFYYADMAGQPSYTISDQDTSFNIKCIICPNTFYNNVALMKHLISHVVYETNDAVKAGRDMYCSYCLKKVATAANLTAHKKDCHMMNTASTSCSICQRKFPLRSQLIQHMTQMHVASEIPYRCNVCHFRSSYHFKVVDHFYESHTGGSSMQCPLCLKVFYASGSRSRSSSTNLMAFYQHLVGHKRQSNRRKCDRCCLIFQQSKHVYEHEDQDHRSMKNVARVVPVVSTESNPTIIIPTPSGMGPVLQAEKAGEVTRLATKGSGSTFTKRPHAPALTILADEYYECIECKQPLDQRLHLSHYMNCLLCRFSTCCSNAMERHTKVFHSNKKNKQKTVDRDTILPQPMYCICGFKSNKGNVLANHLEECERRSAYPNPGIQAQSASFPPLVNLEGTSQDVLNDKWMQAYVNKDKEEAEKEKQEKPDDGSIMGFLGLVRKPSTDEEGPPAKKDKPEDSEEPADIANISDDVLPIDEDAVENASEEAVEKASEEAVEKTSEDAVEKASSVEPAEEAMSVDEGTKDVADADVSFDDMDDPPELPVETEVIESNEVMQLDD